MMIDFDTSKPCASTHFGPWMVRADWMRDAVASVRDGRWLAASSQEIDKPIELRHRVVNGFALIDVVGQMTKRRSSFGGTSTVEVRRALREAAADGSAQTIVLMIDSPGGTVDGTLELADDVRRVDQIKPVYAVVEGNCCSAAYWVASQCRKVYATAGSWVGCIGAYGVLVDTSAADAAMGIEYVLVSSGGVKGLGADGRVTDELVEEYRRELESIMTQFGSSVTGARGKVNFQEVSDGRAWIADEALTLNLIDGVVSLDRAFAVITQERSQMDQEQINMAVASAIADRDQQHQAKLDELAAEFAHQIDEAKVKASEDATQAERERCVRILEKFGADRDFALEQIHKGSGVKDATLAHHDILADKLAKAEAEVIKAAASQPKIDAVEFAPHVPDVKARGAVTADDIARANVKSGYVATY